MRRRPWAVLVAAVLCGGTSAYLALELARGHATTLPEPAAGRVLVAARDVPIGSTLRDRDLKTLEWRADALPSGFLDSADRVVGRSVTTALRANEPILESKLAADSGNAGLTVLIPRGMRAISVPVDDVISVAGFVGPGTRVDVLATLRGDRASTRIILQNVQVLAAGQSFQPDAQGKPQTASVMTLLVTPDQAESLTLAATEGKIHLALRNLQDQGTERTRGAALPYLTGSGRPVESRAVPGRTSTSAPTRTRSTVEIFNGSSRSVAVF